METAKLTELLRAAKKMLLFTGAGISTGSGIPAITDWVTCNIGDGFKHGRDPHTVTAYKSPNNGHAIALLAEVDATRLAVVDLTNMLNTAIVPRTLGGHACATSPLPVTFIPVP